MWTLQRDWKVRSLRLRRWSSTRGLPTSRWNRSLQERGLAEAQVNYRLHDWCVSRQRDWGRRSTASAAAPGFPAGRLRREPAGAGCRRGATPARTPTANRTPTTCATARDSSPASKGGSLSSSPCVAATTVLYGNVERHRVLSELNPDAPRVLRMAQTSRHWTETWPLCRQTVRIQPGRCREDMLAGLRRKRATSLVVFRATTIRKPSSCGEGTLQCELCKVDQ